jgi:hypothetical protein
MTKARITCTYVFEFEMDPDNYPGCNSDMERLAMDIDNFSAVDIAVESITLGADQIRESITGELVKDERQMELV